LRKVLKEYKERNDIIIEIISFFTKPIFDEGPKDGDPFLTAMAIIIYDDGKGLCEFYKSLNQEQLAHIRNNAKHEINTLLDLYCLMINLKPDLVVSPKDLAALLFLHKKKEEDILSIFDLAEPSKDYSKFLFLRIEPPTILTSLFQIACYEHSKDENEENFIQMEKIAKEMFQMPSNNEYEDMCKLLIAEIPPTDPDSCNDIDFRFSWIRSIYLKARPKKSLISKDIL
jgi:hypothetical protein